MCVFESRLALFAVEVRLLCQRKDLVVVALQRIEDTLPRNLDVVVVQQVLLNIGRVIHATQLQAKLDVGKLSA